MKGRDTWWVEAVGRGPSTCCTWTVDPALTPRIPPLLTPSPTHASPAHHLPPSSFGYLTKKGFCDGGSCVRFPVVFGETGSKFNAEDAHMLADFATYMTTAMAGHEAVPNMLWWCWNANSGDTGGLVQGNWLDVRPLVRGQCVGTARRGAARRANQRKTTRRIPATPTQCPTRRGAHTPPSLPARPSTENHAPD